MSYQQLNIVGNVGRDPELKYTQSGAAVCDFSVAVTRKFTVNDQPQERTTWYRVTCWRRTAEIAAQYVKKGRQVMVIADQIEANAYLGNDGNPRASLDVTCKELILLGGRSDTGNGNGQAPDIASENIPF